MYESLRLGKDRDQRDGNIIQRQTFAIPWAECLQDTIWERVLHGG